MALIIVRVIIPLLITSKIAAEESIRHLGQQVSGNPTGRDPSLQVRIGGQWRRRLTTPRACAGIVWEVAYIFCVDVAGLLCIGIRSKGRCCPQSADPIEGNAFFAAPLAQRNTRYCRRFR